MAQFLVDIALPLPLDRLFTYVVPPNLVPVTRLGVRALVPFGKKQLTGIVVGFPERAPQQRLKAVREILDSVPTFSEELLKLSRWISEYYFSPLGEVLKAAAPHGLLVRGKNEGRSRLRPKLEKFIRLVNKSDAKLERSRKLSPKQANLIQSLEELHDFAALRPLLKEVHAPLSTVMTLVKKGIVEVEVREVKRTVQYERIPPEVLVLNKHQENALHEITQALGRNTYTAFLLHGVTGSGKTQVYIEAIRTVLANGKTAIVLVPEISLTPQIVRRFTAHFGSAVAVMHSQMSAGERYDAWRSARDGAVRIVIGPRSAVFAPLANLGLIVVDEEHEPTYKQYDSMPRYHARDVAIVRASQKNAAVVLGSATPSVESYYNALTEKHRLIEMPERVDQAQLPRIEIVDMAAERRRRYEEVRDKVRANDSPFPKRLPDTSISRLLADEIAKRVVNKEGTILLQNRRGFSHVVECYDCGHIEKCDNCEVTLTYHATKKHLRCHYCGLVKKSPTVCPDCGGFEIRFHAFGTQQVEGELEKLFPDEPILRMDLDTMTRKGSHDRMLTQFGNGEANILLGTQMVAKGLDFPRVTLVGVISADTQMLLPDFRSSERTFQLLTQVAGRAGRARLAGEVIIQTLQPEHYSLKHVVLHDFPGFYKEELEYRKELDYPPYSRIVLLEFSGVQENEVHLHATAFAELIGQQHIESHSRLLGPAEAAIPRMRGKFRKHLIIKNLKSKDAAGSQLHRALAAAKSLYDSSPMARTRKVQMTIDVEPQGMM